MINDSKSENNRLNVRRNQTSLAELQETVHYEWKLDILHLQLNGGEATRSCQSIKTMHSECWHITCDVNSDSAKTNDGFLI